MKTPLFFSLLLASMLFGTELLAQEPGSPDRTARVSSKLIANLAGARTGQVSEDLRHFAFIVHDRKARRVVFDGSPQGEYRGIGESPAVLRASVWERLPINELAAAAPIVIGPQGKSIAYVARTKDSTVVIVDGSPHGTYGYAGLPMFSPDGKRLVYVAGDDATRFVVIDGVKGQPYDRIDSVLFSPDGRRLAYIARNEKTSKVVLDDREEPAHKDILDMAFSPDGSRFAYVAALDGPSEVVVVTDDVPSKHYSTYVPKSLRFNPDGQKLTYAVRRNRSAFVVVDTTEFGPYPDVDPPVFSSDGRTMAYRVTYRDSQVVVVNGIPGEGCYRVRDGSIAFSPDGSRLAYVYESLAIFGGSLGVVIDGQKREGKASEIGPLVFSPDGRFGYTIRKNAMWLAVVETTVVGRFTSGVGTLHFSPDGKHVAFTARDGGEVWVLVDGQRIGPIGAASILIGRNVGVEESSFAFSPDGRHFAFIATLGDPRSAGKRRAAQNALFPVAALWRSPPKDKTMVFADGRVIAECDIVLQPVRMGRGRGGPELGPGDVGWHTGSFGSRLGYSGGGINGVEYYLESIPRWLVFDDEDSFHFIARRGNSVELVEVDLGTDPP